MKTELDQQDHKIQIGNKKLAVGWFLDIEGAFDNTSYKFIYAMLLYVKGVDKKKYLQLDEKSTVI